MSSETKKMADKLASVAIRHSESVKSGNENLVSALFESCLSNAETTGGNKTSVVPTEEMIIETFMFNVDMSKLTNVPISGAVDNIKRIITAWENNRAKYTGKKNGSFRRIS